MHFLYIGKEPSILTDVLYIGPFDLTKLGKGFKAIIIKNEIIFKENNGRLLELSIDLCLWIFLNFLIHGWIYASVLNLKYGNINNWRADVRFIQSKTFTSSIVRFNDCSFCLDQYDIAQGGES